MQVNSLKNSKGEIEVEDIKKVIPYNEHFLFIDKVLSVDSTKITATKKFTGNEDFYKGHFVGFPITPGALTVEGLGQTGTFLVRYNILNHEEKDVLAYKLKEVKFFAPILPGDEVTYEVSLIAQDERGAIMQGKALVNKDLVAEALMMLAIVNKSEFRSKYSK